MKTITLAALALVGAVFAATSASAAPFNPGITSIAPDELSGVIQVGDNWKGNHRRGKHWRGNNRWRGDDDNNFSFGFGLPLVAYGLGNNYRNDYYNTPECTGRWHRHASGRLHCHGRLIY